jgi:hypothetical protein
MAKTLIINYNLKETAYSWHQSVQNILKLIITIFCACFFSNSIFSQSTLPDPKFGVMGIYHEDSILLRWAPTTLEAFQSAVTEGFSLERGLFAIDGVALSPDSLEASIIMIDEEINLIDEEDWDLVNVTSDLKAAAIELFYNFQYTPPAADTSNIFSALEASNNKKTIVAIASILADRDWDAAEAIGWAYKDGDIDAGNQYVYILTLLDTGEKFYSLVGTEHEFQFKSIPKPSAFAGDSIVRLTFDKFGLDDYYGYYIERSSDNGQTFIETTDAPVYYEDERSPNIFSSIDSLPDNENEYVYRISGVTPFGLQSEWSDTVSVQGIPGPIEAEPDISSIIESGTGVDIEFTFPEEMEPKIQGFEVIRSIERSGPFLNLTAGAMLSPTERIFHDEEPLYSNYYFVRAIDENNYPLLSIPMYYAPKDSIPPDVPGSLGGIIDNSSQAHLHWSPNNEFDIKGYKIYASNAENDLYVEITPGTIRDTFFTYQLANNVVNSDWYVQIKAIDQNENESELSEPVHITRPDLFPPSSPVLKDLKAYPFGIGMNWVKSYSEDVISFVLQRKLKAGNTWEVILDITNDYEHGVSTKGWTGDLVTSPTHFNYIDSTVEAMVVYQYRALAYDASGNVASSAILEATGYDDGLRGEIEDLQAVDKPYTIEANTSYSPDVDKSAIAIGWNYTDTVGIHHFIVYRSADHWPFKAYQSYLVYDGRDNPAETTDNAVASAVSSGLHTRFVMLDKDVSPGKIYKYKVQAKHLDGGFSRISEVVSVTATQTTH